MAYKLYGNAPFGLTDTDDNQSKPLDQILNSIIDNTSTDSIVSSLKERRRTVSADFDITTADMEMTIAATAACTATPSAAATLGNGFECEIHADGGAVTVGSATVADGSVARLTVRNGKLCIVQGAWAEVTLS